MNSTDNHYPSMSEVRSLLSRIGMICRHDEEIAKITGREFNLFRILGVERYEVSTHSAFIAEMLNPKGSHGQGSSFLELFLEIAGVDDFDVRSAFVDVEYYVGAVTESEGGRLDILIQDRHGKKIVIENKIDAEETPNWVRRYLNSIDSQGTLFYLTLDGKRPTQACYADLEKVCCISYASDILNWLRRCRLVVDDVPDVQHVIRQYAKLVEKLTGKNQSKQMSENIIKEIIGDAGSYKAFVELAKVSHLVRKKILTDFGVRVAAMVEDIDDRFKMSGPEGEGLKGDGMEVTSDDLHQLGLKISIIFEQSEYRQCAFGFCKIDDYVSLKSEVVKYLYEAFDKRFGTCSSSDYWPAYTSWMPSAWDSEVLAQMLDSSFDHEIREKLEGLLLIARQLIKEFPASSAN